MRFHHVQRETLERTEVELESPWGKIKVKKIFEKDGASYFQPEYEACREMALKKKIPLKEIYNWVNGRIAGHSRAETQRRREKKN